MFIAKQTKGIGLSLLMLLLANGGFIHAGVVSFVTPSGSKTGDGAVSAEADFTASAGTLTLTLTNFEQNPTADGQLISGITFQIRGYRKRHLDIVNWAYQPHKRRFQKQQEF
jgi:hypothetical protein